MFKFFCQCRFQLSCCILLTWLYNNTFVTTCQLLFKYFLRFIWFYIKVVSYPHFKVVFGWKVESITLKRCDFEVKVGVINKLWITMWISFNWLWITCKNVDKTIFGFIRYNLNICSSLLCSNNPVLILSNICLYKKFCGKMQKYRRKTYVQGVAKTNCMDWKYSRAYSWFIYTPTKKSTLSPIFKNPTKIKQNLKFSISNQLSYPISLKLNKINTFSPLNPIFEKFIFLKILSKN